METGGAAASGALGEEAAGADDAGGVGVASGEEELAGAGAGVASAEGVDGDADEADGVAGGEELEGDDGGEGAGDGGAEVVVAGSAAAAPVSGASTAIALPPGRTKFIARPRYSDSVSPCLPSFRLRRRSSRTCFSNNCSCTIFANKSGATSLIILRIAVRNLWFPKL